MDKLKWFAAPIKTEWGEDMVCASVEIDNDHTLEIYCERSQIGKVEQMLQQQGLTDEEIDAIANQLDDTTIGWSTHEFSRAIEAKLKEKNHD